MLTQEKVRQLLKYNPENGELIWLFNRQRPDLIGCEAGYVDTSNGYRYVAVDGTTYLLVRLVWFMETGEWPQTIDHINGDPLDDKFSNLRNVSKGQNVANSGLKSTNTTGFKGVSYCSATRKYRASITINQVSKNLGRYRTPEEAHAAWYTAAVAAWGEAVVRAT